MTLTATITIDNAQLEAQVKDVLKREGLDIGTTDADASEALQELISRDLRNLLTDRLRESVQRKGAEEAMAALHARVDTSLPKRPPKEERGRP
jgi:hypothetical protein